ncbi:hypothetical protein RvY_07490 [Ramazzottius varieornatus]|uniref:Gfo/Idh/MocA-like oxidoreductase N-terminal domain-containing protein n=1 Tax=Ramazzottius varieornatus TaxID=947166 RepID=A0A1D1V2D0_RAMVA|nr:hypothetical protein RvY_07490 [Ramazzottius varieornatus]
MLPKIGIFGTNAMVPALISELRRLDFEIIGLWDFKKNVASSWGEKFNIPVATDSIEVLLKDQEVDLVVVCTPSSFHREITTKALAAGKHVICEPPLGLTGADNAAIMEQALYYPSLTLSTFGLRYLVGVRKAKELLLDGTIGILQSFEITQHTGPEDIMNNMAFDWTCIRELCGGPLWSTAVHLIDLVSFLSGKVAYTICATIQRFQENPAHFKYDQHLTREDYISWQMLLEGNIPCTTVINNNFPGKFDLRLIITGSKGSLTLADGVLTLDKKHETTHSVVGPFRGKDQTVPESPTKTPFNYRHPEVVVAGIIQMCSDLHKAFDPLMERRFWVPDHLGNAGTFRDCQYARAVADAVKKSSESRRWTEIVIPTLKPDNSVAYIPVLRFMERQV